MQSWCKSPELLLEKPAVLLTFHTGFLPCILLILVNLAPSGWQEDSPLIHASCQKVCCASSLHLQWMLAPQSKLFPYPAFFLPPLLLALCCFSQVLQAGIRGPGWVWRWLLLQGVIPLCQRSWQTELGNESSRRGGCVLLQQQDTDRLFLNNLAKYWFLSVACLCNARGQLSCTKRLPWHYLTREPVLGPFFMPSPHLGDALYFCPSGTLALGCFKVFASRWVPICVQLLTANFWGNKTWKSIWRDSK